MFLSHSLNKYHPHTKQQSPTKTLQNPFLRKQNPFPIQQKFTLPQKNKLQLSRLSSINNFPYSSSTTFSLDYKNKNHSINNHSHKYKQQCIHCIKTIPYIQQLEEKKLKNKQDKENLLLLKVNDNRSNNNKTLYNDNINKININPFINKANLLSQSTLSTTTYSYSQIEYTKLDQSKLVNLIYNNPFRMKLLAQGNSQVYIAGEGHTKLYNINQQQNQINHNDDNYDEGKINILKVQLKKNLPLNNKKSVIRRVSIANKKQQHLDHLSPNFISIQNSKKNIQLPQQFQQSSQRLKILSPSNKNFSPTMMDIGSYRNYSTGNEVTTNRQSQANSINNQQQKKYYYYQKQKQNNSKNNIKFPPTNQQNSYKKIPLNLEQQRRLSQRRVEEKQIMAPQWIMVKGMKLYLNKVERFY